MKAFLTAIVCSVLVTISACTPAEVEAFKSLGHDDQVKVINAIAPKASGDCNAAIDRHWGGSATAKRIMRRESGNNPSAVSPSGTYRGCMQMGLPLHNDKFRAVGCSPSSWANPDCNIRAAKYLHSIAGWGAWSTY